MYIENLGKNLKSARIGSKLTIEKVAMITRIDISNIEKFEDGTLDPNIEDLATLIDLYKTNANFILGTRKHEKTEAFKIMLYSTTMTITAIITMIILSILF